MAERKDATLARNRTRGRILDRLGIAPGTVMTVRKFLEIVNDRLPGIEDVCTHPTQQKADRREGLVKGMVALGVRGAGDEEGLGLRAKRSS